MSLSSEGADQLALTKDYVRQHKLHELFAHFLQLLLYHQPVDPRDFLLNEVASIRDQKRSSSLFSERDLETMFDLIDVTKQKWITLQQLRNTSRNLAAAEGVPDATGDSTALAEALDNAADDEGHVGLEKFKEVLGLQLLTKNMWSS